MTNTVLAIEWCSCQVRLPTPPAGPPAPAAEAAPRTPLSRERDRRRRDGDRRRRAASTRSACARSPQALGTGPASLYAHVADKDELLALLIERVAGELELPEPDPEHWQEQLKAMVRATHYGLLAHRDLARAGLANIPLGESALRFSDRMIEIMRSGGLPDQVVAYGGDLLPLYAVATAYEQALYAERMTTEEGERFIAEVGEYFAALPADRFPNIVALAGPLVAAEARASASSSASTCWWRGWPRTAGGRLRSAGERQRRLGGEGGGVRDRGRCERRASTARRHRAKSLTRRAIRPIRSSVHARRGTGPAPRLAPPPTAGAPARRSAR